MASTSDVSEGPVLTVLTKRIRNLRKKLNRITQIEQSNQIKNKEQQDLLLYKPSLVAVIDELENLRLPLATAVDRELKTQNDDVSKKRGFGYDAAKAHLGSGEKMVSDAIIGANDAIASVRPLPERFDPNDRAHLLKMAEENDDDVSKGERNASDDVSKADEVVEDLLKVIYFGSLFNVKMGRSEFDNMMLTRTHERNCCLTYDTVTDDDVAINLNEGDLDLLSEMSELLVSRPVDSNFSHEVALRRCVEHAKKWVVGSEERIGENSSVTYAALREKLAKIVGSYYYKITPEMKAPADVAAEAAPDSHIFVQAESEVEQKTTSTMDNFIHSTNNKYDRSMPRLEIKHLFDQVLAKCYPELKRNSIFEALVGDACTRYGDYGFFGVVEVCQKLRKKNPNLFYKQGPIDIAKKIMGEFESRKSKMIKRLQLHDAGILTFRLTGSWMAERIKKVLNDGMDTWAPTGFRAKRGLFVFPTNTIENDNGDMIRAIYIKDALVNMYLYSGVNVGSGFFDDSAMKVVREQFTEKQGVIVSKNSLCAVKGPSNDVYTDLATLWHGANTQKADLMVYMTPHQLRGYINQCHIAAKKQGLVPMNWKGILTCCGFRTFGDEQQELFDLYCRYKEQATYLLRLGLAAGYTERDCFECAFKFTCLKRQRLAECTFKFEDMLYDKEGNSFASLLETRALLRSLVKDYPARNLFALAGRERDLGLYLVKFTEVIERACQAFVPDIVCEYVCNLSKLFTRYYNKVQPGADMLGLFKATEMVVNECFHLLGIAPSSDNYWGNTFVSLKCKKAWETGLYISPISEVDARNNCLNSRFELFSMTVSVAHSNFDEGFMFGTIYVLDKFRSRPDGWELFDKEDDCHVSYFKREWHSPVHIGNGSLVHFENPSSFHSIPFSSPIEVSALVKVTSKEKDQTYVICNCKGTPKVSEFWAGDSEIACGTFKIDGEDGHINLHYILLKDALDTTLELMFNHVKTVRVRGTIVAYYGDDIVGDGGFIGQYKALIFEADPSKSIGHKKPHPLPLHKSTLAVPINMSLKIEAHLVDVDSNKAIVNHMMEFRESMSPSIWKIPFGEGFFEFRVNWLHRVQDGSNQ